MLLSLQDNIQIILAIVILVATFYCIARVMRARQGVSLAFGMLPMMALLAVQQGLA